MKSEVATFFNVFPDGTVWSNDIQGRGYDVVLAGQRRREPINIDCDAGECRQPGERAVEGSR